MTSVLGSFTALAVFAMIHTLFKTLYGKKATIKMPMFIGIWAVAIVGAVLLNFAMFQIPLLNFAYMFVSFCVLGKLLYSCKSAMILLHASLVSVMLVANDMLSFVAISSFTSVALHDIMKNAGLLMAVFLLNLLLLFVSIRVYLAIASKNKRSSVRFHQILFFISLTVAQLYLLQHIMGIIFEETNATPLIIILVVYLLVDIYIAYLLHRTSKIALLEMQLKLIHEQVNMQSELYSELSDKHRHSAIISHDIKKHITALEGLIDRNHIDSASQYIGQLNQELDKLAPQFKHNNSVLAVIVNHNLAKAAKLKIDFAVDIEETLPTEFVADMDLTTILANVLDNAVEACVELSEEKRFVKLVVTHIHTYVLINVSNSFKQVLQYPNGSFASTKTNHGGIGLTGIKTTVEKYDGSFDVEVKKDVFIAKITLPVRK